MALSKSNENGGPACRQAGSRFSPLDHPSDIGIVAYGKDRKEIFENAAYGMFSVIADLRTVESKEIIKVKLESDDPEALLINWLNELLLLHETRGMLFSDFQISKLTDQALEAEAAGEKINADKHTLFYSIKAATYNQLQLSPAQAKIVFDV